MMLLVPPLVTVDTETVPVSWCAQLTGVRLTLIVRAPPVVGAIEEIAVSTGLSVTEN
jgi:hypothetical protein